MDKRENPTGHQGPQMRSSTENESMQAKRDKGMEKEKSPQKTEGRNSDGRRR